MTAQRTVLVHALEGLLRHTVGDALTPELAERLAAAGVDPRKPLQATYPEEVWARSVHLVAQHLYPRLPLDAALGKLGERFVEGYGQTLTGKIVLSFIKLFGPAQALKRATENFRSGATHTETRLRELGPTEYELWINDLEELQPFTRGILRAALGAAGARDLKLAVVDSKPVECTLHIRWEP